MSGWSLEYFTSTGASFATTIALPATSVAPGGSYLIAETGYSPSFPIDNPYDSPTPDDSPNISGTDGWVGLYDDTTLVDSAGSSSVGGVSTGAPSAGDNLPAISWVGSDPDYAWVRNMTGGAYEDTGTNSTDFTLVSANGAALDEAGGGTVQSLLGDPTPNDSATPAADTLSGVISWTLMDPAVSSTASPNVSYSNGVLTLGYELTNVPSSAITALDLRFSSLTTLGSPSGYAELEVQSSPSTNVTGPNGFSVTTATLNLNDSSVLAGGGGVNSTLAVTLPNGSLSPGESFYFQFTFKVPRGGRYSFSFEPEVTG